MFGKALIVLIVVAITRTKALPMQEVFIQVSLVSTKNIYILYICLAIKQIIIRYNCNRIVLKVSG